MPPRPISAARGTCPRAFRRSASPRGHRVHAQNVVDRPAPAQGRLLAPASTADIPPLRPYRCALPPRPHRCAAAAATAPLHAPLHRFRGRAAAPPRCRGRARTTAPRHAPSPRSHNCARARLPISLPPSSSTLAPVQAPTRCARSPARGPSSCAPPSRRRAWRRLSPDRLSRSAGSAPPARSAGLLCPPTRWLCSAPQAAAHSAPAQGIHRTPQPPRLNLSAV